MRYFMLTLLCWIAVISYVQRLGVNSISAEIEIAFDVNTEEFGLLGSVWLIGYALMQVPAGTLADRMGSRNALILYAVAWSILTGSIGLCQDFTLLLVLWFLLGMTMAGVFPCAAKSIAAWFPDTQKATASGLLGSCTLLGAAIASTLTPWLVIEQNWAWQITYACYGAIGIVWAIVYGLTIPERSQSQTAAPPMTRADWQRLVGSASMWLICGQQFFRAAAMIFFLNWFPTFLKQSWLLTEMQAGRYASYALGSAMLGGIFGGFFSDWLLCVTGHRRLSRQGIAVVGMTTCSVLIITTYFVTDETIAILVFSLGAFIAAFGGVSGYTVTIEFGGKRVATVFSIMNMSGNFGAALAQYAAGLLKERTGNWDTALFMFVGIFAVDAVCWALLNPRRPLFEDSNHTR
jgi:nitrate/nitrite transporter NarK